MTVAGYEHRMAAHCESGTVAALLTHAGLVVSEPMVFGVAGAIFFGYFRTPVLTFPMVVLRNRPGFIRSQACRRLGARVCARRFRSEEEGMRALDASLDRGLPVGVQVDFQYMEYIPAYARAHFNAHFIVVVGREAGGYVISDSYAPRLCTLPAATLRKARFVRGPFAPRGLQFVVERVPAGVDWERAVRAGIRNAVFYMTRLPVSCLGVRGIRRFARRLPDWPRLAGDEERLSHELMMLNVVLEERGTGGGGFRFLYATFLQEAAALLREDGVRVLSRAVMDDGDRWRDISLQAARMGKHRDMEPPRLAALAGLVAERADQEERIFRDLAQYGRPARRTTKANE